MPPHAPPTIVILTATSFGAQSSTRSGSGFSTAKWTSSPGSMLPFSSPDIVRLAAAFVAAVIAL